MGTVRRPGVLLTPIAGTTYRRGSDRVANLTPEEAQELEAQALAVLGEPLEVDEETGGIGVVGSLMIAAALVYLVLLPIVGAGTIVRWLW